MTKKKILSLSTITGIIPVLMLSSNAVYGQDVVNYTETTTEQTIELLKYKIEKGEFMNKFVGQVKNSLDDLVSTVKITSTFYDKHGDIISTKYLYTDPQDLLPQSKVSFEMYMNKNIENIKSYDVIITWTGVGSGIHSIKNLLK